MALLLLLAVAHVGAAVRYVNVNSATPSSPYTTWATAAAAIQDAIDVAADGDDILVTDGVYQTGGRVVDGALTNRVAVTKPLAVRSVNGPGVTVIAGYQEPGTTNGDSAVRCVYLVEGAALVGFTLTNGATRGWGEDFYPYSEQSGGGVWCSSASCVWCTSASAVVADCVLSGNSATFMGGGAYQGTLNNCVLSGNSAIGGGGGVAFGTLNNCVLTGNSAYVGGGAYDGTLNNCTLTGNSGGYGGGARQSTLENCIVYYNAATVGDANYDALSTLNYSCATPLPSGVGNFDNAPLFVDPASGNWRLQPNSPCINAGSNPSAPSGTDLDGNRRIVGGTVDVGAYEFQSPGRHRGHPRKDHR